MKSQFSTKESAGPKKKLQIEIVEDDVFERPSRNREREEEEGGHVVGHVGAHRMSVNHNSMHSEEYSISSSDSASNGETTYRHK